MTSPVRPVSPIRYTLLALLFSLLWAAAFIAVKVGLRSAPPFFLMASRFLAGGILLLGYARLRGIALPATAGEWCALGLLGLLNNAVYLGLSAIALRRLSAGMAAILASTNPLLLALVAAWWLGERLTARKVAGMLASFAGVVWIMRSRVGGQDAPDAMALALLAICFLVAGTVAFKRIRPPQDLLVVNGAQLLTSGLALLAPSLLWEPVASVRLTGSFLLAQAFLVLGVSCAGMLIWFWLLRNGDASRASAYFFLNPVLGLFLGWLALGESMGARDVAGTAVVAAGIYLVQRSDGSARPTAAAAGISPGSRQEVGGRGSS